MNVVKAIMFEQRSGTGTRFGKDEISRFIAQLALHHDLQGYHLTTIYKNAQTANAADGTLKRSIPKLLSEVIGGNWIRAAKKGKLVGFGFLDTPGSRGSSSRALAPLSAQRDYHHHCILLVSPGWTAKIDRLASLSSIELEDDPAHSPFRRRMARSSARTLRYFRGMLVVDDIIRNTPLRSLMIQRLPDQEDIERAANYAAKSLHRLSAPFPDEAFSVLTHMRQRSARKVGR
jgi:hypothetical protein